MAGCRTWTSCLNWNTTMVTPSRDLCWAKSLDSSGPRLRSSTASSRSTRCCRLSHGDGMWSVSVPVSYTHLRAHETRHDLVCRLLLEKKKKHKPLRASH